MNKGNTRGIQVRSGCQAESATYEELIPGCTTEGSLILDTGGSWQHRHVLASWVISQESDC